MLLPMVIHNHSNKWSDNHLHIQVKSYIPDEAKWESIFPFRNALYTYESFLQAVAKFPNFCGEAPDGKDPR